MLAQNQQQNQPTVTAGNSTAQPQSQPQLQVQSQVEPGVQNTTVVNDNQSQSNEQLVQPTESIELISDQDIRLDDLKQPTQTPNIVQNDVAQSAIVEPTKLEPPQKNVTQSAQSTLTTPTAPTKSVSVTNQANSVGQNKQQKKQQQKQHDSTNFTGLLKILIENKVLTTEQAGDINSAFLSTNRPIEQILEDHELVSEVSLTKAKAELNKIPYVVVAETGIAPEAMNKIDESVAKRYQTLPFALNEEEGKIKVAMSNPLNITAVSFIEQKTGMTLVPYYASPSEIDRLIGERYAQDLSSDVTAAIEENTKVGAKKKEVIKDQQGGFIRVAPINKIVDTILDYAMQSRASDIHIEPLADKTRVRYRIDGVMMEKLTLPRSVHDSVVSRIKILSDLKIDEKRVPQDGRFDYQTNNQEVDLRISTMPSIHGEKIVMRLLKKNAAVPALEELGMRGLSLRNVRKSIRIPHGIFLVTGPTGSGKTTSLYSILDLINTPKVNIMTLEDPVEYQMNGVNQVQVHPQAGLTFANGLRAFLRQDPDIIMVGEIRDQETAELAVQASLTGHLVFSTLHTNSAVGALPRLEDMGIEPFLLSSSMILVMGQRVVRVINESYKEEYRPEQTVLDDIKRVLGENFDKWCQQNNKNPDEIMLCRAREDRPQTEPEYKGRVGIFEVMDICDEIKTMINQSKPADDIEEVAMKAGMIKMKQDGYLKVLDGLTTVEEVLRVAEER